MKSINLLWKKIVSISQMFISRNSFVYRRGPNLQCTESALRLNKLETDYSFWVTITSKYSCIHSHYTKQLNKIILSIVCFRNQLKRQHQADPSGSSSASPVSRSSLWPCFVWRWVFCPLLLNSYLKV